MNTSNLIEYKQILTLLKENIEKNNDYTLELNKITLSLEDNIKTLQTMIDFNNQIAISISSTHINLNQEGRFMSF